MMTFEEYREKAFDGIRIRLRGSPKEEVEAYIASLEDDVKKSYDSAIWETEKFGDDVVSPSSYAYGAMMDF